MVIENQESIHQKNANRIKDLMKNRNYRRGEKFELHIGFEKMCGLRGSMLSGG